VVAAARIELLPAGVVSSLGGRAVELVRDAGLELDGWQRGVLHGGLGVKADDSWAADEVALVCPRQNGKTALAAARIMLGLSRGEQLIYTSHRIDSAGELFALLVALVRASPELEPQLARIIFSNGREAIHLQNGGRCLFGTRSTSRTGRGFSLDTIILDEAHYVSEESLVALGFTGYARGTAPQRWYLASAVDRDVHEHGITMSRIRERAIRGETTALAYYEWSAAVVDDEGRELECGQVTPEQVDDEALWFAANPALGARVPIERVRAERETMPHRGFLTERLGIGAWCDTSETVAAPISGEQWASLEDRGSKRVGELVLAFDTAPDRRCALVACGRRGDELLHVELLRTASGTGWLVEEIERLSERFDVMTVVADGYGGNLAIIRQLEDAGHRVRSLTGGEHAAACAQLVDLVAAAGFRHIGQGELLNALRGAKARPLGDGGWAWSRKGSTGDIAAVVAMTFALAAGSEIELNSELVIY
jgi:phage terminase large subunit-like protein